MGFAEVHPGLQFVRHRLQSLQVLQRVHLVDLLQLNCEWTDRETVFWSSVSQSGPNLQAVGLTLAGPRVRLQHQELFGLFQLFLQTLILGPDFADALLPVLQQAKLGAHVQNLLVQRTGSKHSHVLTSTPYPQPPPQPPTQAPSSAYINISRSYTAPYYILQNLEPTCKLF